jgi:hypothetical protein
MKNPKRRKKRKRTAEREGIARKKTKIPRITKTIQKGTAIKIKNPERRKILKMNMHMYVSNILSSFFFHFANQFNRFTNGSYELDSKAPDVSFRHAG